ncbi:MAG: hypothetical protein LAP21_09775, partial [Acidobacteriia bacterium]|nr:hypothetical protein [Terriglobia bacterium]
MTRLAQRTLRLFLSLSLLTLFSSSLIAEQNHVPEWTKADHAKTIPLRDMAPMKVAEGHRDKPIRLLTPAASAPAGPDTALQTISIAAPTVGNVTSFDGVGQGAFGFTPNAAPPDTNGSVGDTQYVQWVNESFGVFSKTGTLLAGPTAGNTLFQALGATHPCAVHNDGDPIAQYDKAAKRWVMTQFSVTSGSSAGFWQCVAVSQTADATGAYNVYAFNYGTVQFNDYPKLGVWNNSYLVTYNIFNNGATFAGAKLCALDRTAMLAGTAATQICFQLSSSFGGVLPSDIDGLTPPPAGSPAYFMAFGANVLQLWQLSNINFTAGTATLTGSTNIPVAAFSAACGGGTCIPQLGTTQQLDSLGDRLMYRLAYRNFGDHEALVVNHSITSGTSTGVRWYEVRSPGTTPTLFQQGTFAPDASFRWMGSTAMDSAGNMAVGYSVSSSSLNPGIRFTARAPGDPLGTMGSELTITNGTGSQLANLNRWGDYSNISVDPVDDCTFWYTTEYLKANGTFNWSTRIANFKFAGCGTPDFTLTAAPASVSADQGTNANYTATVTPLNGFTGTVDLTVAGLPTGATATFTPASLASGNSALAIAVGSATPAGSYPLTITGTSGTLTHTANVTLVVTVPVVGDFTVTASPASQTVTAGANTSYTATVTPVSGSGFNGTVTFSASGLPTGATASFSPASVAVSGSSTMTVTTSASTPAGTYTLTITGTAGALVHSTTVTLIVNAPANPDFTITATPASQTITRNTSGNYTVTITAQNGFTGTVSLSVTGLPSRVTATFTPTSVTGSGTSTMRITVNRRATVGTSTLTIHGVSGT